MKCLIFSVLIFVATAFGADSTKVVDGKFTVYTKGATLVDGLFYNGLQFMSVSSYARTPEEVAMRYLTFPSVRDYVAGTLRWGVIPTNTWINLYDDTLKVVDYAGNATPVKEGTVITVRTWDGFNCGYGQVGKSGKLSFLPVYGCDQYGATAQGPVPGEYIYVCLDGTKPLMPVFGGPIVWTNNGDRIKLPDMMLAH